MEVVLREACDNCHRRKTRCISRRHGACANCRDSGQVCTYSPRNQMGRPRQRSGTGHQGRKTPCERSTRTLTPQSITEQERPTISRTVCCGGAADNDTENTILFNMTVGEADNDTEEGLMPLDMSNDVASTSTNVQIDTGDGLDSSSTYTTPSATDAYHETFGLPKGHYSLNGRAYEPVLEPRLMTGSSELPLEQENTRSPTHINELTDERDLLKYRLPITSSDRSDTGRNGADCVSESNTMNVVGLYGQLSQSLFSLQSYREGISDSERMDDTSEGHGACLNALFNRVSCLCDLVTRLPKDMPSGADKVTYYCLLLAVSVVNTVMDIYQTVLDRRKTLWLDNRRSAVPWSSQLRDTGIGGLPQWKRSGTQSRLAMLLDTEAMDFHLEQLQRLFAFIPTAAGTAQAQSRLATLRQQLQKWSEELRNMK
ncbi:fungal zn(2)-Cys(6) binuclear cluster domain-containing protein [Pochonia chlamydosporia 170]|uniref:Fungal zn(2)-Cys(6) binuclear cluster domain-containing protein n=1 Tax=Pochonia chlamydosporia 170 TaxID=1380566 RepID=A0A179EWR1_METCM|nr:fungal zn(2)-Cys(6) binuclear cluster domain-containing protein [Pochonia chlamydosporia 170]OAQ57616.2 fungal zn(2)-Cys(6) binuclear cluster domain-containing protein [Pochonia chlamydosporia 170]